METLEQINAVIKGEKESVNLTSSPNEVEQILKNLGFKLESDERRYNSHAMIYSHNKQYYGVYFNAKSFKLTFAKTDKSYAFGAF